MKLTETYYNSEFHLSNHQVMNLENDGGININQIYNWMLHNPSTSTSTSTSSSTSSSTSTCTLTLERIQ